MKKLLIILLSLCITALAQSHTEVTVEDSQTITGTKAFSQFGVTVATLPASPVVNDVAIVTDGNGVSCTSGGGSNLVICRYNGSTWQPVSGGSAFTGQLGTSYQDVTEIATPSNPTGSNDRLYLGTDHLVHCLTSGGGNCLPVSGGTVTSVGLTAPSVLTVGNSPITSSGNISLTWNVSGADQALISSGSNAAAFVAIVNCTDSSGNHLNYSTSTHLFTCGTTSSTIANGNDMAIQVSHPAGTFFGDATNFFYNTATHDVTTTGKVNTTQVNLTGSGAAFIQGVPAILGTPQNSTTADTFSFSSTQYPQYWNHVTLVWNDVPYFLTEHLGGCVQLNATNPGVDALSTPCYLPSSNTAFTGNNTHAGTEIFNAAVTVNSTSTFNGLANFLANMTMTQAANGNNAIAIKRFTDTSPTGCYVTGTDTTGATQEFCLGTNGNLTVNGTGTFGNGGAPGFSGTPGSVPTTAAGIGQIGISSTGNIPVYGYNGGANIPFILAGTTTPGTPGDVLVYASNGTSAVDGGAPGGGGAAALTKVYNTTAATTGAAISATTMVTPGSNTWYKINFYNLQIAAGVGCTAATTINANVIWTDPAASSSSQQTVRGWVISTSTGNGSANTPIPTASSIQPGEFIFQAKASTTVQFSTQVSVNPACGTSAPTYSITPWLWSVQ